MHQRVAEANAEKAARDRLQEEVEAGQRAVKKLKERQEIVSASGGSVSANEVQMKDERDKLLVSGAAQYPAEIGVQGGIESAC
jgi:E3 ubiquitin-protein ligase BRE1